MRNNHVARTLPSGKIALTVICERCEKAHTFEVDGAPYLAWMSGELVQNAFPQIDRKERELLVSGTCGKCWAKMFGRAPRAVANGNA